MLQRLKSSVTMLEAECVFSFYLAEKQFLTSKLPFSYNTSGLTLRETEIITLLLKHHGTFVNTEVILNYIYGRTITHLENPEGALRVAIGKIRKKFRNTGNNKFIETKQGFGYRLVTKEIKVTDISDTNDPR